MAGNHNGIIALARPMTRALLCILLLGQALNAPTVAQANPVTIDIEKCKIPHVNINPGLLERGTRIGWPLTSARISGSGSQKILVLPIDFSDAAAKQSSSMLLSNVVQPELAKRFYSVQSNGALSLDIAVHPTVHRMQMESDQYGSWSAAKTSWGLNSDKISKEIEAVLARNYANVEFAALAILVTGGSSAWKAWGAGGVALTADANSSFFGKTTLKNVMYLIDSDGTAIGDTFIHELGHLFGFVDLYAAGYMGDSTGPFDVMAYPWEKSKSFLGWNLWLKGWVQDSQVVCMNYANQPTSEVSLTSVTMNSGTRLIVIRESAGSVIVVEARLNTEYDKLASDAGLLVYRVQPGATWPERFVQIIPHSNEITAKGISPDFPDAQRFLKATITNGKYLRERYLLIENRQQSATAATVALAWFNEAITLQRQLDGRAVVPTQVQTASALELAQLRSQLSRLETQLISVNESMESLKLKNVALSKRIASICKPRPKPRGC